MRGDITSKSKQASLNLIYDSTASQWRCLRKSYPQCIDLCLPKITKIGQKVKG